MTVTGLHHASITVADLDRSLHFYRDLLGVPVREQVDAAGDVVHGGLRRGLARTCGSPTSTSATGGCSS